MVEVNNSYITKTKSINGLKTELIKKYKIAFLINSTTRIYDMNESEGLMDFFIEKPSRSRGYITYSVDGEKNVVYNFINDPIEK